MSLHVAIVLFDDVEVLDFCGPFEVFSVAAKHLNSAGIAVSTVAATTDPVSACNGLSINPMYDLDSCPPVDVLVVPGGIGTRLEMQRPLLVNWIGQRSKSAQLILSVCTGALLLARAGILEGLTVTTHHGALDLLADQDPSLTVVADRRFVDNGRVVTSAGIAAGIDMSLHVVDRLFGSEVAETTAHYMEYPWRKAAS